MSKKKSKPITASGKFKKRVPKYQISDPDRDWYTPQDLRGKSLKELKDLYTELRDVSQKRLKRLREKYPDADVLTYHPESFPTIKQLKEESGGSKTALAKKLRHSLSDVSRFVQSPYTTLTGQKELTDDRIKALDKHNFFKDIDDEGRVIHDYLNPSEKDIKAGIVPLTEEELRGVLKFVHWVQKTQHLNIMYHDEFVNKIKQSRFRQAVRRTGYGKGKDYGRQNYARWYEQITGLKPEKAPRKTRSNKPTRKAQPSSDFNSLR